jgi:hypothetical protein
VVWDEVSDVVVLSDVVRVVVELNVVVIVVLVGVDVKHTELRPGQQFDPQSSSQRHNKSIIGISESRAKNREGS